jgi:hypothetical protein
VPAYLLIQTENAGAAQNSIRGSGVRWKVGKKERVVELARIYGDSKYIFGNPATRSAVP